MLTRFIAKELREDEYAANGTAADADKAAALAAHRLVDVVAAHNYHGAEMVEAGAAASTEAVAEPRFADDVPLATRVWSVFAAATRELLRTVLLLGPAASGGALWLANSLNVRPPQKALSIALASSAALLLGCYGWGVGGCGAALVGYAARNSGAILAQFCAILLTLRPPPYRYAVVAVVLVGVWAYLAEGWRRAFMFWRCVAQFGAILRAIVSSPPTVLRLIGKMILHYKLVKLWGQQADIEAAELDVIYNQLHRKYAPRTLALILKLRGFYVKIGQVGC